MAEKAKITLPFRYDFSQPGVLSEVGRPDDSASPYFWLNSGGLMPIVNGRGMTVQGEVDPLSPWAKLYERNNPEDTDGGMHPQNVFRLFTREEFGDAAAEVRFRMSRYNLSASAQRKASNGCFIGLRSDVGGDNLYYFGLRVDGYAVIKSKKGGVDKYDTLATAPVLTAGVPKYDREANPNLMTVGQEVVVRFEAVNDGAGVRLRGTIKLPNLPEFALEAFDDGVKYRGAAIQRKGLVLIRTDFGDFDFDDLRVEAAGAVPAPAPAPERTYEKGVAFGRAGALDEAKAAMQRAVDALRVPPKP